MKSLNKFVLIILLLQPCLAVPEQVPVENLVFGDMLTFPCYGTLYEHYAVYVDNVPIQGKEEGQNIFEMTRNPSGCRFNTVTGIVNRKNYLDNLQNRDNI